VRSDGGVEQRREDRQKHARRRAHPRLVADVGGLAGPGAGPASRARDGGALWVGPRGGGRGPAVCFLCARGGGFPPHPRALVKAPSKAWPARNPPTTPPLRAASSPCFRSAFQATR